MPRLLLFVAGISLPGTLSPIRPSGWGSQDLIYSLAHSHEPRTIPSQCLHSSPVSYGQISKHTWPMGQIPRE